MLRQALVNLITKAMKFTRQRQLAEIEIGCLPDQDNESIVFIRDKGVGFDMAYLDKLFGVFQRLNHSDQFESTAGLVWPTCAGLSTGMAAVHGLKEKSTRERFISPCRK